VIKTVVIALFIVLCGCASTYRTTITETRENKISLYVSEYSEGKITKQQLLDLIMIYVENNE